MLSSAVLMLLGLAIALYAREFDLGALDMPGPGFMPFLTGVVIFISAAIGMLEALKDHERDGKPIWNSSGMAQQTLVLGMVFAFGALLEQGGFLLCSFFLVLIAMRFIGAERWRSSIGWAAFLSVCSYVLFVVWLKVDLPAGLLRL